MNLEDILLAFKKGDLPLGEALTAARTAGYRDLGHAKIDTDRSARCGAPEVIFCPGKSLDHLRSIAADLAEADGRLLATRATVEQYEAIRSVVADAEYEALARCVLVRRKPAPRLPGRIAVFSAGTADVPVAEEARVTAEYLGHEVDSIFDVGVAGIHRLLAHSERLARCHVAIVVAGMEGALPSVVAGLSDKPVLAVPTSVGYGASLGGLTALFAMLNSCASKVAVFNIDNGFGAASTASAILRSCLGTSRDAAEGGTSNGGAGHG